MSGFDEIYRAYFSDVYLYLKSLSGDENIAEEMTSETFFKAMRSIDRFRGDCDIRVWLCQIAKNNYRSFLKKSKRFTVLEDYEDTRSLEDDAADRDRSMLIHTHLHELAEPYKEVFMLRVFGELSFKQIGGIFGRTENWACVAYHRARNKIKEKMEDAQ